MISIKTGYLLPAYNYKVSIGTRTMSFSEVSGLNISYEKVVYKDGMSHLTGPTIIRAQKNQATISLKRGMTSHRKELNMWLQEKSLKDIFIDLCDEMGIPVIRWKLISAMPLKIDAPSFSASSNELAIEHMELIVRDLNIEYL
ncbi:phage tail protein [Mucilaginibacter sp. cycad4]|uniref:phage tail protein n=1 Tax=Mucilaginibacter sp. cycad4 TaxID=3342096 RepID=UPI002AAB5A3D|nr:phage tail protein [Mucilaginibacter gossypii]WPV01744.1 phage tail protein [Mucilaginibacter gossypii]